MEWIRIKNDPTRKRVPASVWCFVAKTFVESNLLQWGNANERGQQDIACAPYQSIGKETANQYCKVKPCIAKTVLADDPGRVSSFKGLSRMMGNYQVRFLGESGAAMPRPYPVRDVMSCIPIHAYCMTANHFSRAIVFRTRVGRYGQHK